MVGEILGCLGAACGGNSAILILALIEPHYPKAGNGPQPMPMERMLRIYFMQQWFNLSDPAMEDSLYDSAQCLPSRSATRHAVSLRPWQSVRSARHPSPIKVPRGYRLRFCLR